MSELPSLDTSSHTWSYKMLHRAYCGRTNPAALGPVDQFHQHLWSLLLCIRLWALDTLEQWIRFHQLQPFGHILNLTAQTTFVALSAHGKVFNSVLSLKQQVRDGSIAFDREVAELPSHETVKPRKKSKMGEKCTVIPAWCNYFDMNLK